MSTTPPLLGPIICTAPPMSRHIGYATPPSSQPRVRVLRSLFLVRLCCLLSPCIVRYNTVHHLTSVCAIPSVCLLIVTLLRLSPPNMSVTLPLRPTIVLAAASVLHTNEITQSRSSVGETPPQFRSSVCATLPQSRSSVCATLPQSRSSVCATPPVSCDCLYNANTVLSECLFNSASGLSVCFW